MRLRLRLLVSALALATPALSAQTPVSSVTPRTDETALQLLREVTAKYARAVRSHIESATETIRSSEMDSMQRKGTAFGYEAPGNRYRAGGRNYAGTSLVVSDGTTEWEYHGSLGEYVQRAAGAINAPIRTQTPSTAASIASMQEEREGLFVRKNLGLLASTLRTAHWSPDETIVIGGRNIACWVIRYRDEDYLHYTSSPNTSQYERRVWIDKSRKLIVKTEQTASEKELQAPYGDPVHLTTTVTYPVVSLDEPIPDDAFTFTPPAGAKLVDAFNDPQAQYMRPVIAIKQPTPPPNYIGTPAPDLSLTAADGKTLDLASLRGKPVLLDLWATWCDPCLIEMPTIDRIYRFAKSAGLVVLGVDQDKNPGDALAYLNKNSYEWPDYHDGWKGKYEHLGVTGEGIPMLMLIDEEGKIVYFHSGDNDDPGLLAAVRHLGPAFSSAIDASQK